MENKYIQLEIIVSHSHRNRNREILKPENSLIQVLNVMLIQTYEFGFSWTKNINKSERS